MTLDCVDQRLILACFSRNYNQPLSFEQLEMFTYLDQDHMREILDILMAKGLLVFGEGHYYLHNDHYLGMLQKELIMYDDLMKFIEEVKPRLDEVWLTHQRLEQSFDLNAPLLIIDTFSGNQTYIKKAFEQSNLSEQYRLEISNALKVTDRVAMMDHESFIERAPISLFIA